MSRINKTFEREIKLVVVRSCGEGRMKNKYNGMGSLLWSGIVLAHQGITEYTQAHQIVYFRSVNFMIYEYLNKIHFFKFSSLVTSATFHVVNNFMLLVPSTNLEQFCHHPKFC